MTSSPPIETDDVVERLRAALSWIEMPFVTAETLADELHSRISFCLADAERAIPAIERLREENARLRAVAEQAATALHPFIYIIAHHFDGDGTYYWMRDPTHDEAQAAMKATNAVSAALTPSADDVSSNNPKS